jgi:hypothetical protein
VTYGTLTVELREGKRVVTHAENPERILATGDLLWNMESDGYKRGGLYWFDDAGTYLYRRTHAENFLMDSWVMERVR